MMKMLLATVALATVIASPALAQSAQRAQSQVRNQAVQTDQQRQSRPLTGAVYDTSGHYIGSDPDPRIRGDLQRDQPERIE